MTRADAAGDDVVVELGREVLATCAEIGRPEQLRADQVLLAALAVLLHRYDESAQSGRVGLWVLGDDAGRLECARVELGELPRGSLRAYARHLARALEDRRSRDGWREAGSVPSGSGEACVIVLVRDGAADGVEDACQGLSGAERWLFSRVLRDRLVLRARGLAAGDVSSLAGHLERLLQEAERCPRVEAAALNLLTEQELATIGDMSLARDSSSTPHVPLYWEFLLQAEQHPERVAVREADVAVTYGELARRAAALAARLRRCGVVLGDRLALTMPRSIEFVAAVLGTLMAGGVCVPLDPAYPSQRTERIRELALPKLSLAASDVRELWGAARDGIVRGADVAFDPGAFDPKAPALLLFTSGSTGDPKGVVLTHAGRGNRHAWLQRKLRLGHAERHLLKAATGFSTMVRELFWPLGTGAEMLVVPAGKHANMDYLTRLIARERVTVAHFVPSLLEELLRHPDHALCRSLVHILSTGERLEDDLARRVEAAFPGAELHALYGSTEAPTAAYWSSRSRPVPACLGKPAGVPVLVLSPSLQPVPVGVPGEIFVGGEGLADAGSGGGAASRFLDVEFLGRALRVYRTGDLARWKADGSLEGLGRRDLQIKIRGCRVEPSEVAQLAESIDGVKAAFAIGRQGADGEAELVLYWTPEAPALRECTEERLHRELRARLPSYLVPRRLVALEHLPRNSHGKVDVRGLPEPRARRPGPRAESPKPGIEAGLVELFEDELGLEGVGPDDDFFRLGGHSLGAVKLQQKVAARWGKDIPLAQFFESPSPRALASVLERAIEAPVEPGAAHAHRDVSRALPAHQQGATGPLTSAQNRLWFMSTRYAGGDRHHVCMAWILRGPLNVPALKWAFARLVERHAALRTAFVAQEGRPEQRVTPPGSNRPIPFELVSGAELYRQYGEEPTEKFLEQEWRAPFDLAAPPLMRARAALLRPNETLLALTLHHIICDAWSRQVLLLELSELYAAALDPTSSARQRLSHAPPSPRELAPGDGWLIDLALRERRFETGAAFEADLDYWRRQLQGVTPIHLRTTPGNLGADATGRCEAFVGEELTEQIEALAREQGATPFMVLFAAYVVLLGRASGARDIAVVVPAMDRHRVEHPRELGCLLDLRVLRVQIRGDGGFAELLRQVREVVVQAEEHGRVTFERLVQEVPTLRSGDTADTNPLALDAAFNYVSVERQPLDLDGLDVHTLPAPRIGTTFSPYLYVFRVGRRFKLRLNFRMSKWSRQHGDVLLSHYLDVLSGALAEPVREVDAIRLGAGRSPPRAPAAQLAEPAGTVLDAVRAVAQRSPDVLAVNSARGRRSYAELWADAERLGAALQEHGVRAGQRVGLVASRTCPALVSAMLAIWLCKGVVVALDAGLPPKRRAALLGRAGCRSQLVVAGDSDLVADAASVLDSLSLDPLTGCIRRVEGFEPPGPALGVADRGEAGDSVGRHDAAYVVFTSGSTGSPKAVLGSHAGLAHFLAWERGLLKPTDHDRVALLHSLSFDPYLRDVFLPLTSGATLCLPDRDDTLYGAEALGWLQAHRVSILHLPPAIAREWLARNVRRLSLDSLRAVLFAGEPLSSGLVRQFVDAIGYQGQIFNLYGPSETTLAKCCRAVDLDGFAGIYDVGLPLPDTDIVVVDERGRENGAYEPGEVVIRTRHPAHGYLSGDGAIAGDVVPLERSPNGGYPTGDLGFLLADGRLVLEGRKDDQIKVLGARLNPREVEDLLAAVPGVLHAAVVPVQSVSGRTQLDAFVQLLPGAGVSEADIQRYVAERAPTYMVPTNVRFSSEWPRTQTGKLDRRELARLAALRPAAPEKRAEPAAANALELQLVAVWEDLLGLPRVDVDQDFFALGGHSMLALELMGRVESAFGVRLPVGALFPSPTVRSLARAVAQGTSGQRIIVPFRGTASRQERTERPALYCVHTAGGSVVCYQQLARQLGADQPFFGFQLPERCDVSPAERTSFLADTYVRAMKAAQSRGPYHLAGHSYGGLVAYEMARQLRRAGDEVALVALFDTGVPGSPDPKGSLMRALHAAMERCTSGDDSRPDAEERLWSELHEISLQFLDAGRASAAARTRNRLGAIADLLREHNFLPNRATLTYEQALRYLRQLRDDLRAAAQYRPEPTTVPLYLFLATEAIEVNRAPEYRAGLWRPLAGGGLETVGIPGNHMNLLISPAVEHVATHLGRVLEQQRA